MQAPENLHRILLVFCICILVVYYACGIKHYNEEKKSRVTRAKRIYYSSCIRYIFYAEFTFFFLLLKKILSISEI